MRVHLHNWRPIKCSKCGSTDAVKPVNDRDIAIRCNSCGHFALTPEAQRRQNEAELRKKGVDLNREWSCRAERDEWPTF